MLLATSSLQNPAAFVYGAAKFYPEELDRISKIENSFVQASEIGRLHEKMVKNRAQVSGAPKPIEPVKGDLSARPIQNQPSIDQRITDYGRQKQQRR
jgi:hypothetical protein